MKNKYLVIWSESNLVSDSHKRTFDNYHQAQWFANQMKKCYDFVLCTEEKNWEGI